MVRMNSGHKNLEAVRTNLKEAINSSNLIVTMNVWFVSLATLYYVNGKKVSFMTRFVVVYNKLVTTFLANIFNGYSSEKCLPVSNLRSTQTFETIKRLNSVHTDSKKILNLMQGLN